ncbi:hypothetical protein MXB_75 [Myxobolus squamalis]|nr:hypothetical protein MXB_75 [Myxobolus squamalis]
MVQAIDGLMKNECSNISKKYSIGQSVHGRELLVMKLSVAPNTHQLLQPRFFYEGNLHGNEASTKEILLHLVKYLCVQFKAGNQRIIKLISNTEIHVLFSANPDGFESSSFGCMGLKGRHNANGIDLNR